MDLAGRMDPVILSSDAAAGAARKSKGDPKAARSGSDVLVSEIFAKLQSANVLCLPTLLPFGDSKFNCLAFL